MKRNLLLKSGISLLILGGVSMGPVFAAQPEGGIYEELKALHDSLQGQGTIARGAQGPIRSVDVQPRASDIYESLSLYQDSLKWDKGSTAERGAQGPMRSDADMAMDRNREDWKRMVGIFTGSD